MYMNVVVPNCILFRMFAIQIVKSLQVLFSSDSVNFGCRGGVESVKLRREKGTRALTNIILSYSGYY